MKDLCFLTEKLMARSVKEKSGSSKQFLRRLNSVISAGKSRVLHPNKSTSLGSALGFNSNNTQTLVTSHNTLVTA